MMLHPFVSELDDGYNYYTPRSYQQHKRRALAAEKARRCSELERYYRIKKELELQQEQQEQRRLYHEFARRLRQQQLEEEAYQQALLRRRAALEEEVDRQEYLRALRYVRGDHHDGAEDLEPAEGQEQWQTNQDDETEEEPVYRLMRGMDGRIYRVQVGTTTRKPKVSRLMIPESHQRRTTTTSIPLTVRDTAKKMEPVDHLMENTAIESISPMIVEENKPSKVTTRVDHDVLETNNHDDAKVKLSSREKKNKRNKKRLTIIVEDASDSEVEDDLKSPWRNRRPSPGEWMEPVECFDQIHI